MPRIAISEFCTYRWTLEQEVEEFNRRGIRQIGLWRTKLSDLDIDAAADLLYTADIRVSSLSWAGGFTGSCGMSHDDAIDDAKSAIRTAARVGAPCLIVHPGDMRKHTRSHARRIFRTAMAQLLPVAADYGITLGIELATIDQAPRWTSFETVDEIIELVGSANLPSLGIVLDTFFAAQHSQLQERLPEIIDMIALVQLAGRSPQVQSAQRTIVGDGCTMVRNWFHRLEDAGYQGAYEVELHGTGISGTSYRRVLDDSLETLRTLRRERQQSHGLSPIN